MKKRIFRVHLHFRKIGMILNQMYLTCNSFSPGTHEGCKWNTFTLLEINNLYLWENGTRWKQNMCGFMKCYNFTACVKNFIWDIWSNSASKFNHHPLADNTSVNTSVAYLSSLNLKWENTEGLLWLFSEARNLFLKVFLEGHSLFFSSFKLLGNDFFPLWNPPHPFTPYLRKCFSFLFFWFAHSFPSSTSHTSLFLSEREVEWQVCPRLPGFWSHIIDGAYQLPDAVCFLNTFISSSSFLK